MIILTERDFHTCIQNGDVDDLNVNHKECVIRYASMEVPKIET